MCWALFAMTKTKDSLSLSIPVRGEEHKMNDYASRALCDKRTQGGNNVYREVLTEQVTFEQKLDGREGGSHADVGQGAGTASQPEGTASAKVLRSECGWDAQE